MELRACRIREYLVLDPLGEFLHEPGRGWRLEGGVYVPWQPNARGRWESAEFPMAFAIEEEMVTVFGPGKQRQRREGEITHALRQRDDELAHKDAELARKDAELEELRRRLEGG